MSEQTCVSDRPSWPCLRFTDNGRRRLEEVFAFLDDLEAQSHPQALKIRAELFERLGYLDGYGGAVNDDDPRRRFQITLSSDFAPFSFELTWERLDLKAGEYVFAFAGGLIWHGGANDPLCVALTSCFWGIHT